MLFVASANTSTLLQTVGPRIPRLVYSLGKGNRHPNTTGQGGMPTLNSRRKQNRAFISLRRRKEDGAEEKKKNL